MTGAGLTLLLSVTDPLAEDKPNLDYEVEHIGWVDLRFMLRRNEDGVGRERCEEEEEDALNRGDESNVEDEPDPSWNVFLENCPARELAMPWLNRCAGMVVWWSAATHHR